VFDEDREVVEVAIRSSGQYLIVQELVEEACSRIVWKGMLD
jgi:hypothetical protein